VCHLRSSLAALSLSLCLFACPMWGAKRNGSDPGEHLIAVVPLIGAGTPDDPLRPMFIPKPNDVSTALAAGQAPQLISHHYVIADDGKTAIVEFVAARHIFLKAILDAGSAGSILLAIIEKRIFLNLRPTGIAVGRREMDQSRDCGDRRSRTGIRSPSEEAPAK